MPLGAIVGGILSGGASLVSGLLGKSSQDKAAASSKKRNKAINKSNELQIIKTNRQNVKWNEQVQRRANAAAKVPIVTKNTGQDVTSHTGRDITRTSSSVDVDAMMKAAEKSGFNPVTWLQNGGMQAYLKGTTITDYGSKSTTKYGSTQTVTGSHAMDAALVGLSKPGYATYQWQDQGLVAPGPGIGEVVGNALQNGFNAWNQQSQQESQNQFQMDLLNAQIKGVAKAAASAGFNSRTQAPAGQALSGFVPQAITSGTQNKFSTGALSSRPGSASGYKPGTSVRIGGWDTMPSPDWSDSDDFTTRYGDSELMQTIYGIGVAAGDLGATMETRYGKPFRDPYSLGVGARTYLAPYIDAATGGASAPPRSAPMTLSTPDPFDYGQRRQLE